MSLHYPALLACKTIGPSMTSTPFVSVWIMVVNTTDKNKLNANRQSIVLLSPTIIDLCCDILLIEVNSRMGFRPIFHLLKIALNWAPISRFFTSWFGILRLVFISLGHLSVLSVALSEFQAVLVSLKQRRKHRLELSHRINGRSGSIWTAYQPLTFHWL